SDPSTRDRSYYALFPWRAPRPSRRRIRPFELRQPRTNAVRAHQDLNASLRNGFESQSHQSSIRDKHHVRVRESPNHQVRATRQRNLIRLFRHVALEFIKGYALNRAWQEIPSSAFVALRDTVRNRILKLALEIRDELGTVNDDIHAIPP